MKKLAVLMTCYNRVETTLRCLDRLFQQQLPAEWSFDVFLVDDASPDKTGERVASAYPSVHVIQSPGNLYWCKGMRLAWDTAVKADDFDAYLWLNDDVMLNDGALKVTLNDLLNLSDSKGGVIVGTMSNDERGDILSYGCYGCGGVKRPNGRLQESNDYSMSGNFVLIPTNVFKSIGPISGVYSHAYGDSDYRMRLLKAGFNLYCSSVICGVCPLQPQRYLPIAKMSLKERFLALSNPKGVPIRDVFIFRYRHWGLFRAIVSTVHVFYTVVVHPVKRTAAQ